MHMMSKPLLHFGPLFIKCCVESVLHMILLSFLKLRKYESESEHIDKKCVEM